MNAERRVAAVALLGLVLLLSVASGLALRSRAGDREQLRIANVRIGALERQIRATGGEPVTVSVDGIVGPAGIPGAAGAPGASGAPGRAVTPVPSATAVPGPSPAPSSPATPRPSASPSPLCVATVCPPIGGSP